MRNSSLLLALAVALLLSACGSSDGGGGGGGGPKTDTETFEAEGIGITFEYPPEMEQASDLTVDQSVGAQAKAEGGVGYDTRNVIFVQRFDLERSIGKEELGAIKPQVDSLFEQGTGKPGDGEETEIGGLPALEYESAPTKGRPGEQARLLVLFDGDTEYTINCQSDEERREDIEEACDTVVETLEKN